MSAFLSPLGSTQLCLFNFFVSSTEIKQNDSIEDFPGGPVVKTSPSNAGDVGSIPSWGAKIPHASWPKNQNIKKQKQYCNKFNKDFKNGPQQKKRKKKKKS